MRTSFILGFVGSAAVVMAVSGARPAEAAFEGGSHFVVKSVDCRTTSCVASLTFESNELARRSWGTLLHSANGLGCARTIYVDLTDAPGNYEAQMLFECSHVRGN